MARISVHFERWLRRFHVEQSGPGPCSPLRILRQVQVCGGAAYDLVSYAADPPSETGPTVIDLWTLRSTATDKAAFGEACANLELAGCLNDQVREGFLALENRPPPSILLRGNLVAPSVEPCRELSEVADSGQRIRLWTHSLRSGRLDVLPYCAPPDTGCEAGTGTLERILLMLSASVQRGPFGAGPAGQRRRFERRPVSIPARIAFFDSAGRLAAEREVVITDLSPTGARLSAVSLPADLESLQAGTVVLIPIAGEDRFTIPGQVVRVLVRASAALGVEFRGLSRLSTRGLRKILVPSTAPYRPARRGSLRPRFPKDPLH
jgi:hypothetical protein